MCNVLSNALAYHCKLIFITDAEKSNREEEERHPHLSFRFTRERKNEHPEGNNEKFAASSCS
jgi:hypothetical protein